MEKEDTETQDTAVEEVTQVEAEEEATRRNTRRRLRTILRRISSTPPLLPSPDALLTPRCRYTPSPGPPRGYAPPTGPPPMHYGASPGAPPPQNFGPPQYQGGQFTPHMQPQQQGQQGQVVYSNCTGKRKALCIGRYFGLGGVGKEGGESSDDSVPLGINYVGTSNALAGCHNDASECFGSVSQGGEGELTIRLCAQRTWRRSYVVSEERQWRG